jgi:PAS domain-containing protein
MVAELATMRKLVPVRASEKRRLSQIQLLSIVTAYITKSSKLKPLVKNSDDISLEIQQMCNFEQALYGFILAITSEGRLLYISENVTDYLGYTMMDLMTHSESVYDITDECDHDMIQLTLEGSASDYVVVNWRFIVARRFRRQVGCQRYKELKVRGRFVRADPESSPLFLATCTTNFSSHSPSSSSSSSSRISSLSASLLHYNTMSFSSVHRLDMKFIDIDSNGLSYYGYTHDEMIGKSWYEMVHPDDIENARNKHLKVVAGSLGSNTNSSTSSSGRENSCSMYVRLQTRHGHYIAVRMDMKQRRTGQHSRSKSASSWQHGTSPVPGDVIIHVTNHILEPVESQRVFIGSTAAEAENTEMLYSPIDSSTKHRSAKRAHDGVSNNVGKCHKAVNNDNDNMTTVHPAKIRRTSHIDSDESENTIDMEIPHIMPAVLTQLPECRPTAVVDTELQHRFPLLTKMVQTLPSGTTPLASAQSLTFGKPPPRSDNDVFDAGIPAAAMTVKTLPDCLLTPEQSPHSSFDFEQFGDASHSVVLIKSAPNGICSRGTSVAAHGDLVQVVPDSSTLSPLGSGAWEPASGVMQSDEKMPAEANESSGPPLPELDLGILDKVLSDLDEKAMNQLICELESSGTCMVPASSSTVTTCNDVSVTASCSESNRAVPDSQQGSISMATDDTISSSRNDEVEQQPEVASSTVSLKLPGLLSLYQSILKCTIAELVKQQQQKNLSRTTTVSEGVPVMASLPSMTSLPLPCDPTFPVKSSCSLNSVTNYNSSSMTATAIDDSLLQCLLLSSDLIGSFLCQSQPPTDVTTLW